MADADYRRLAAACHCGAPVKLWSGRGKRPTYCSKLCGVRARRGNKPRGEVRAYTCAQCSKVFESTHSRPMYCGKACKVKACIARDPARKVAYAARARVREQKKAPQLCAYFAKTCERCGKADGRRQEWALCRACKRADALAAGREASLALSEAKHKAAGREVECDECGALYCPLYGANRGPKQLCSDQCSDARRKQSERAAKVKRRAAERGVDAESVNPWRVFSRDGWACMLCKVDTPRQLRGTCEHNAPELDHVVPLSRGGPHTYSNTQCLCRSCNQFKSDRTMDEVERALAA